MSPSSLHLFKILSKKLSSLQPETWQYNNRWCSRYSTPRIVLLGLSGSGKSSVALSLLGKEENYTFNDNEKCFKVGTPTELSSVTKEACHKQGHLFGVDTETKITVIDTPGWGIQDEYQFNITEKIVDLLSQEIQYVNTFAILLKGSDNRKTTQIVNTMRLIKTILGKDFVDNIVLVATHWSHFGESMNEEAKKNWLKKQKQRFKDLPGWENLKAVYYKPLIQLDNDDEKVREQLKELVEISMKNEERNGSFHCIDIKKAVDHISQMEKDLKELQQSKAKWDRHEKCRVNLQNCSTTLNSCKLKMEDRLEASTMTMVGVGLGSSVLGVILGFYIFRSFTQRAHVDFDVEEEEQEEEEQEEEENQEEQIIIDLEEDNNEENKSDGQKIKL